MDFTEPRSAPLRYALDDTDSDTDSIVGVEHEGDGDDVESVRQSPLPVPSISLSSSTHIEEPTTVILGLFGPGSVAVASLGADKQPIGQISLDQSLEKGRRLSKRSKVENVYNIYNIQGTRTILIECTIQTTMEEENSWAFDLVKSLAQMLNVERWLILGSFGPYDFISPDGGSSDLIPPCGKALYTSACNSKLASFESYNPPNLVKGLAAAAMSHLQNLIKRDPTSYRDEFIQQYRHYQASLSIFKLKPTEEATEFGELITFISQITQCYPEETKTFPQDIISLLQEHYQVLHPELRKTCVQALILLRNKDIVDNMKLLPVFFTLFRCRDKALRQLLYTHIVNDIKNSNAKAKNNRLNKTLQSFMFTMLESAKSGNSDENAIAAKRSVDVCVELYRKNVWNDAKTVNVIAEACFSPVTKISVTAIQFFLGSNEKEEDEDEDNEETIDLRKIQQANLHNRKTKSKARQYEAALKKVHRMERKKTKAEVFNFSALHLLNDPQGFAEKLFGKCSSKTDKWEVRLMIMNLVSRLIGVHKLSLDKFYSFLIKYLQPQQRDVTMVLVSAAQATHELVPPDDLEPILKAIANNFVTEHCAAEVIAAGINGIREICARQPLAMDATLLQDLSEYKNHRDKGVFIAARSLIGLFREVNPELLKRKDRGKVASMSMKAFEAPTYGATRALGAEGIRGIDLLDDVNEEKDGNAENEDDGWEGWEIADSEDESEDGWINVSSDDDDIHIDMSDDEEETKNAKRISKKKQTDNEEVGDEEAPQLVPTDDTTQNGMTEEERKAKMLKIATTRILTPADFAKMQALSVQNKTDELLGKKRKADDKNKDANDGEFVDVNAITGPRKKAKQDYEERMASIREGREGREKFGSRKGKTERGSTTNREKAKKKNFVMISHKQSVIAKGKMSLRDKQIQLRSHINKQKKRKH
ncbi:hypothetical protein BZG36_02658 [Bifiguratus adelaidae]|uniref:Protein SDA1 n=1 Tax=Bifiguratus adelaidae TaxID=1938954 RepID=A0A261Y2T3_9FUNG|nr:hypothetical protein BZG36_02658 [Bifiguratus adelaidae]